MHFVNHNFTDIDFETKHMSRVEKTIYLDLRSIYLSSEKPIDGSDMPLLERRLSIVDEDEKQALAFVLKDKFNKTGKYYKRAAWDKVLKNYKHSNRNKGNAIGNEVGNEVGNTGNGHGNASGNIGNDDGNALSNAERVAKSKQERKTIIANLNNTGVSFDKKAPIADLRILHEKYVVIDGNETGNESNAKNAAITKNHEPVTNNHKPVSEDTHTNTGEVIVDNFNYGSVDNSFADNQASQPQPTPVELPQSAQPSANQPATKADLIRDQRADDIENWQAPDIGEMRGELFRAGKMMQLTDDQYALHVEEFKAHYAEQALRGKAISTESNRKAKLRKWLTGEVDKQAQSEARQEKAKGRFTTDNEDWTGTTSSGSNFDSDLPPIYHPSHSTGETDDSAPLFLNGLKRNPLPGMTTGETSALLDSKTGIGESRVAAYDRLFADMKEAV